MRHQAGRLNAPMAYGIALGRRALGYASSRSNSTELSATATFVDGVTPWLPTVS